MVFNSLHFVVFLLIVYALYFSLGHRWQNRMLLLASYIFYACWDWRFLSLILVSTLVDYASGLGIYNSEHKIKRRLFLSLSLTVNLGLLGFFKYFNFFIDGFQSMVSLFGFQLHESTMKIVLPVGISFYTFQTLSYTIDVYRKQIEPERNFLDFALFVAFFPQLVAGPIERARNLLPQVTQPRRIRSEEISRGLWLIFWGYFLKVFVADNLSLVADKVFANTGPMNGWEALMGTYAFAFQIFGDFAGYSSIAIGVALLMGFHLMTNFLQPYLVTNPRDFWRNWHISLSTWLKDYVYIPLGGNRGPGWMTYRNLFLTMVIGGLWHGAAWTFVLWGLYHGVVLIIHRFLTPLWSRISVKGFAGKVWYAIRVFLMFQVTCFGWILFRSRSIAQIRNICSSLLNQMTLPSPTAIHYALQILFFTWLVAGVQMLEKVRGDTLSVMKFSRAVQVSIFLVMYFSLSIFGNFGGKEFVYFQF